MIDTFRTRLQISKFELNFNFRKILSDIINFFSYIFIFSLFFFFFLFLFLFSFPFPSKIHPHADPRHFDHVGKIGFSIPGVRGAERKVGSKVGRATDSLNHAKSWHNKRSSEGGRVSERGGGREAGDATVGIGEVGGARHTGIRETKSNSDRSKRRGNQRPSLFRIGRVVLRRNKLDRGASHERINLGNVSASSGDGGDKGVRGGGGGQSSLVGERERKLNEKEGGRNEGTTTW